MKPPPEEWTLPAPPLSPEEALKSFRFGEEGFALELVAAEPLILNPVCVAFDGNGRPWVCEMRGYMPNLEGKGEEGGKQQHSRRSLCAYSLLHFQKVRSIQK